MQNDLFCKTFCKWKTLAKTVSVKCCKFKKAFSFAKPKSRAHMKNLNALF